MVSDKVLKRVKACQNLIDRGMPLRRALLQAHVDIDTYKKYRELIISPEPAANNIDGIKNVINDSNAYFESIKSPENIKKIFKDINKYTPNPKKPVGRPRKFDMKKIYQKISLEQKYIDRMIQESNDTGIPLATIEATYIIDALKKKYKDL